MLDIGVLVFSSGSLQFKQGVIYKKHTNSSGWAHFTVLWANGERTVERADKIKTAPSLSDQKNDLVVLEDLRDSIVKGGTY